MIAALRGGPDPATRRPPAADAAGYQPARPPEAHARRLGVALVRSRCRGAPFAGAGPPVAAQPIPLDAPPGPAHARQPGVVPRRQATGRVREAEEWHRGDVVRVTASAALLAMRMWWPIIVIFAVLGVAGGMLAIRDAPYAAVTAVRVDTAGFGEVAQQSIVETSRLLVDSNRTYSKVVGESPGAIEEIRQRTAVEASRHRPCWRSACPPRPPGRPNGRWMRSPRQRSRSSASSPTSSSTGPSRAASAGWPPAASPDAVAENARRDALGTAIAEQQDNALRLSG